MTTILNQPSDAQFGNVLISKMDDEAYRDFMVVVAFARTGGVLRLGPALRRLRQRGGTVVAFVGVDFKGTSYEALVNLFNLCDELYVVHAENGARTFHPKVYVVRNSQTAWVAVGSNNLTGGGLWTNWESCACYEYDLATSEGVEGFGPIERLVATYRANASGCSRRLNSMRDIDSVLDGGYVEREAEMRLAQSANRVTQATTSHTPLFQAQQRAPLPSLPPSLRPTPIQRAATLHEEDFSNELFWFETRSLTGGSRNILDLSKQGRIVRGSAISTPYATADSGSMLGGVAFFGIDPNNVSTTKNITINYEGQDYVGCTIKYPTGGRNPNGSWRLQLKGSNPDGTPLSRVGSPSKFVHKILVFEKIRSDYYALSALDESQLSQMKSNSKLVAYNGGRANARLFGML